MGFSVDKIYNNYGVQQGIDIQAVKKIANQIFANAQDTSFDLQNLNLSKLDRSQAYGIDLYRTNTDTAIQTSLRNSDIDLKLSENFVANVQFLNSQAAQKNAQTIAEFNSEDLQTNQIKPVEETPAEQNEKINIFEPKSAIQTNKKQNTDVNDINTSVLRTTDADVKLVQQTKENVQYLNLQAAKEHYNVQKVEGKIALPDDNFQKQDIKNIFIISSSQEANGSQNMDNNRRGSNPFSFYMAAPRKENDEEETKPINLIA